MTLSIRRRQVSKVMWVGLAVFLLLQCLDLLISYYGFAYGAVELNPVFVGGLTLQNASLKLLVYLSIGLILMHYNILVEAKNKLWVSSNRLFKGLIGGQFVIVCFVATTLFIHMYMF